jgi:hypothetical protein
MSKQGSPKRPGGPSVDASRLDKVVADARRAREDRERGYREQALKLYPWVCGRCGRSFTYANVQELTVHHRDHNHDNNPPDGSNWELLCLYCHDNEHSRYEDHLAGGGTTLGGAGGQETTHRPFEALQQLLKKSD